MLGFGALPVALPGFTDSTNISVQDKSGIFWVADSYRAGAATAIGLGTTFTSVEESGVTQFGSAFAGGTGKDWVANAVASGRAVLVKPSPGYAAPAISILLTSDPYRIAFNAARSFDGDYAVLSAPTALVAKAQAEVAKGYRGEPEDYASDGGSSGALPSWVQPAIVGAIAIGLLALSRTVGGSTTALAKNSARRGRDWLGGVFGAASGPTASRLVRARRQKRRPSAYKYFAKRHSEVKGEARLYDLIAKIDAKRGSR